MNSKQRRRQQRGFKYKAHIVNHYDFYIYLTKIYEAKTWIKNNIKSYKDTTTFRRVNDCAYFEFKYFKDATLFHLVWGS
jgi:hypothetical protein